MDPNQIGKSRNRPQIPFRVALLLLVWTAYGVFFASQSYIRQSFAGRQLGFQYSLVPWLICGYTWAVFTLPILFIARRFPFERGKILASAAVHVPLSLVFSLMQMALYLFVFETLIAKGPGTFYEDYRTLVLQEFHAGILIYFAIVAFSFVYGRLFRHVRALDDHSRIDTQGRSNGHISVAPGSHHLNGKTGNGYVSRISVKENGRIVLVDVSDIYYIASEGNYVMLYSKAKKYLVRDTMNAMEQKLDPAAFVRIRRSTIVRTSEIAELHPLFNGDLEVVLKTGARLPASRRYRKNLETALRS